MLDSLHLHSTPKLVRSIKLKGELLLPPANPIWEHELHNTNMGEDIIIPTSFLQNISDELGSLKKDLCSVQNEVTLLNTLVTQLVYHPESPLTKELALAFREKVALQKLK